jgi:hypothetical protein
MGAEARLACRGPGQIGSLADGPAMGIVTLKVRVSRFGLLTLACQSLFLRDVSFELWFS